MMDAEIGEGHLFERGVDFLSKAPPIAEHSLLYWRAYSNLQADRQSTMDGLGPIPTMAILHYAQYLDMYQHEADEFLRVIRAVDSFHCGTVNKTLAAKRKASMNKAK